MYLSILIATILLSSLVFATSQTNFSNLGTETNLNGPVENGLENIQSIFSNKTGDSQTIVLLAIDSSSSQDSNTGRFNMTKKSVEKFIDNIIVPQSKVRKIGVIVWNSELNNKLSLSPTSDFDKVKQNIDSIRPGGNTCIGIGLDVARMMLSEENSSSEKFLVVLSNGKNEYCNDTRDVCKLVNEIKQLGTKFYIIGEKESEGSLSCIENSKRDILSTSLNNIFSSISNDILNSHASNNVIVEESSPFSLRAHGKNVTIIQKDTNVTVSKIVESGPIGPRIVLKIKTPPPDILTKILCFL